MSEVTFFFDVGSPYAYLAAERLGAVGLGTARWQPILLGGLFGINGRGSWAVGDADRRRAGMEDVEARAARYGLPAVRWPERWPSNYLVAMRAVTFAFGGGRGPDLALAAMRAAFAGGVELSDVEQVLAVAEQAGLPRTDVKRAVGEPEVKDALRAATNSAHAAGVFGVPTVRVAGEVFWGDDRLEEAAARSG